MRGLIALLLLAIASLGFGQAFEIRSFEAVLRLDSDGTLHVTENIDVVFRQERRGIFRVIPIALDNGRGSTRSIFIDEIVSQDATGRRDQIKVSGEDGDINIRIGDPDVFLKPGARRIYSIRYRVQNAINWIDATESWSPSAELYWNVTGNEWEVPIQKASVRVHFPKVENGRDVQARIFLGPYGSRESQVVQGPSGVVHDPAGTYMRLSDDVVEAGSERSMSLGEGMTVVLGVPADTIAKPSLTKQIWWFLIPNLGYGLPIITLLLGVIAYRLVGKDPYGGPMVVQFDAPDDLSGSELGAFLDERVDQRDVAAGFVSLAVKGYLIIEPTESGLILKRTTANLRLTNKPDSGDLTLFESELLQRLRLCSDPISEKELSEHVGTDMYRLKNVLYASLATRGYYPKSPATVRAVFALVGFFTIGLLAFLATVLTPLDNPIPAIVGSVLSIPVLIWATKHSPRRTPYGAKVWQQARGFEDFMRRARTPEFEWINKQKPDQSLFEKYLPHAIALGLVEQWTDAFQGIDLQTPSWYAAPYGHHFHAHHFAGDMKSLTHSVGSAASTPPRSSGASGGSSGFSSGGGFSGGGFGGGGGGSW